VHKLHISLLSHVCSHTEQIRVTTGDVTMVTSVVVVDRGVILDVPGKGSVTAGVAKEGVTLVTFVVRVDRRVLSDNPGEGSVTTEVWVTLQVVNSGVTSGVPVDLGVIPDVLAGVGESDVGL
jgi:hypothetical protein